MPTTWIPEPSHKPNAQHLFSSEAPDRQASSGCVSNGSCQGIGYDIVVADFHRLFSVPSPNLQLWRFRPFRADKEVKETVRKICRFISGAFALRREVNRSCIRRPTERKSAVLSCNRMTSRKGRGLVSPSRYAIPSQDKITAFPVSFLFFR